MRQAEEADQESEQSDGCRGQRSDIDGTVFPFLRTLLTAAQTRKPRHWELNYQHNVPAVSTSSPVWKAENSLPNVDWKPSSMTPEMVRTGRMSGEGTLESTWTDDNHAEGTNALRQNDAGGAEQQSRRMDYNLPLAL